jgi:hypothetical protein
MSILPARPLRLQRSFVLRSYFWGLLWLVVGLGVATAYEVWQARDAMRITQDQDVWAHGTPSEFGNVSGNSRSRYGIFKEYDLNVSYSDGAGATHTDHFSFSTLGGGIDDNTQPALRFDPRDPSHYAISWAVECTRSRWASVAFMAIVGALIGIAIAFIGWAMLGQLRIAQRVAKESEEVECNVVSETEQIINGRPSGNMVYRFLVPALPPVPSSEAGYRDAAVQAQTATTPVEREVVLARKKGTPIYTQRGPSGDKLLALVSRTRPKDVVMVRHDFHPFDLTEEQKEAALARIAG